MTTNERTPARWDNATAANVLHAIRGYVGKYSTKDDPHPLNPEAREEVAARIVFDLMTGEDIPADIPLLRHVFRRCRLWRIRGWAGDCELDRDRKRASAARERENRRTPGTADFERARNKDEYRGASADSRQPTPLAQLVAIESATLDGLRYVSDRQAKQRRRAVKHSRRRIVRTVPGPVVGPVVIDPDTGSWTFGTGARQCVTFTREDGGPVNGKKGRSHLGTIANRAIGKKKADALGTDPVGVAMARMAILGVTPRARFSPAPLPTTGVPATPGDGTEWRTMAE